MTQLLLESFAVQLTTSLLTGQIVERVARRYSTILNSATSSTFYILCSTYAIRKISQNEIPDGRKIEAIRMVVVCCGMPTVVPYRQGR